MRQKVGCTLLAWLNRPWTTYKSWLLTVCKRGQRVQRRAGHLQWLFPCPGPGLSLLRMEHVQTASSHNEL